MCETKEELKKEKNMDLLKNDTINPVIKEVINELYPLFYKNINHNHNYFNGININSYFKYKSYLNELIVFHTPIKTFF